MNRQLIVGVMGGGDASADDIEAAYRLGRLIAEKRWILLNGGRNRGIMEASAKGAADHGGLTIGILPDDSRIFEIELLLLLRLFQLFQGFIGRCLVGEGHHHKTDGSYIL